MVNGYVTYNELITITGFAPKTLEILLREGMSMHEFEYVPISKKHNTIHNVLFDYKQVEKWICLHIY